MPLAAGFAFDLRQTCNPGEGTRLVFPLNISGKMAVPRGSTSARLLAAMQQGRDATTIEALSAGGAGTTKLMARRSGRHSRLRHGDFRHLEESVAGMDIDLVADLDELFAQAAQTLY